MVLDAAGQPIGTLLGSRIANAAAILGRAKYNVLMASEAAADPVGDIVVRTLAAAGVATDTIDRFTEGRTPLYIYVGGDATSGTVPTVTRYEQYPDECFDIVWPRVNEGDVVVYGGFYAIDSRMRQRLKQFLLNAAERKAVLVYLPGFLPQLEPRLTRVMPQILENLEIAQIVVARATDLSLIFGVDATETCYHDHIDFYCRSLIAVEPASRRMCYYSGNEVSAVEIPEVACIGMSWNAGAVAGVAAAIVDSGYTVDLFDAPEAGVRSNILARAAAFATDAARSVRFDYLGF